MASPPEDVFRTQNLAWQARLQGVPLASFRARLAAFLVDGALLGVLLAVPNSLHSLVRPGGRAIDFSVEIDLSGAIKLAIVVLYFAVTMFLGKGATPGKRLLGIRVVSLNHERLSFWHAIERTLGYAASSLEVGFGFLQYFTHPNRQTVHDRIAETIVIRTRPQAPPPSGRARSRH